MIRMLIFLTALMVAAALITVIASLNGYIEGRAFGYEIYWPVGVVIGSFVFLSLGLIFLTSAAKDLVALPKKIKQQRQQAQHKRGLIALTRGLEAVAAEDANDAQRHARSARTLLQDPPLTRLLTAQAAQLAGDIATAETTYKEMLDAPETEFLGLRGLYALAIEKQDTQQATGYAQRAFRLRPNAEWAFASVYQLSVDRGAWGEAEDAIKRAIKRGLPSDETLQRQEAVLLSARAYTSHDSGDTTAALRDLDRALKLQPDFVPAALLAARLYYDQGKTNKAWHLIEQAWQITPHKALGDLAKKIISKRDDETKQQKLRALAALNPDHPESKILVAEQFMAEQAWEPAKALLEPLLEKNPTATAYQAMAKIVKNLYGEERATPFLEKVASAPRAPLMGEDGSLHITVQGWQQLLEEYGKYQRLAPPPIEEYAAPMSPEEITRLLAPPPKPESEPESTIEPEPDPLAPTTNTPIKPTLQVIDGKKSASETEEPEIVEPPADWVREGLDENKT